MRMVCKRRSIRGTSPGSLANRHSPPKRALIQYAALDFAIEHGIPHGGWCPHGRKAEGGTINPRYNLRAGKLLVAYSFWFRYALPHEQHA